MRYELHPIGHVESALTDPDRAPKQGDEGAPDAWLVFDAGVAEALRDLEVGAEVLLFTWLDGTPIVDVKPVLEPLGER